MQNLGTHKMLVEHAKILLPASRGIGLGEGPTYDPLTRLVYFADLSTCTIRAITLEGDVVGLYEVGSKGDEIGVDGHMLGTIFRTTAGEIGFARNDGIYLLDPTTRATSWFAHPARDHSMLLAQRELGALYRYNEGQVDPMGRLTVGTMLATGEAREKHPGAGKLYSIRSDGSSKVLLEGLEIPNGIAWAPKDDKCIEDASAYRMFHIDTMSLRVMEYTQDAHSAELSNPRVVATLDPEITGYPDGMYLAYDRTTLAVRLVVCCFNGSKAIVIDAETGAVCGAIKTSCKQTTSCVVMPDGIVVGTSGAEGYENVSAAGINRFDSDPHAGSVWIARVPHLQGTIPFLARIDVERRWR